MFLHWTQKLNINSNIASCKYAEIRTVWSKKNLIFSNMKQHCLCIQNCTMFLVMLRIKQWLLDRRKILPIVWFHVWLIRARSIQHYFPPTVQVQRNGREMTSAPTWTTPPGWSTGNRGSSCGSSTCCWPGETWTAPTCSTRSLSLTHSSPPTSTCPARPRSSSTGTGEEKTL